MCQQHANLVTTDYTHSIIIIIIYYDVQINDQKKKVWLLGRNNATHIDSR